jgi:mycothiol system anti-sigma-R factor
MDRLDQLVDRELSRSELAEAQLHLEDCRECADRYRFEEGMKRLVRVSCCEDRAPDSLRLRLREILSK